MGRPQRDLQKFHCYLPKRDVERLRDFASAKRLTVAQVIRAIINLHMTRLENRKNDAAQPISIKELEFPEQLDQLEEGTPVQ